MADSTESLKEPAQPVTEEGNRRSDILHAAGRLFREKGYNGTTIRDIAAAVNMRSGSPFYHFKTKHDMLRAVVLDGMQTIHDAVHSAAEGIADPKARFRAMIVAHLQALLGPDGRDFAAAVLHECRALDAAAAEEMCARKDTYEQLWSAILDELKAAGHLHGDMHLTRLLLLGGMNWTTQWFDPDKGAGPEEIADQLMVLAFGNCATVSH